MAARELVTQGCLAETPDGGTFPVPRGAIMPDPEPRVRDPWVGQKRPSGREGLRQGRIIGQFQCVFDVPSRT